MGSRLSQAVITIRKTINYVDVKSRPACRNCTHSIVKDYGVGLSSLGKQYYCPPNTLFVSGGAICDNHESMKK